jgi:peroxiredoxin
VARQFAGQVEIIGVPSSDTLDNMDAFVQRHGLDGVRQAVDLDRDVWRAFGVPGQPSWGFVTPGGETSTHIGPLFGDGLVQALEELLAG